MSAKAVSSAEHRVLVVDISVNGVLPTFICSEYIIPVGNSNGTIPQILEEKIV